MLPHTERHFKIKHPIFFYSFVLSLITYLNVSANVRNFQTNDRGKQKKRRTNIVDNKNYSSLSVRMRAKNTSIRDINGD